MNKIIASHPQPPHKRVLHAVFLKVARKMERLPEHVIECIIDWGVAANTPSVYGVMCSLNKRWATLARKKYRTMKQKWKEIWIGDIERCSGIYIQTICQYIPHGKRNGIQISTMFGMSNYPDDECFIIFRKWKNDKFDGLEVMWEVNAHAMKSNLYNNAKFRNYATVFDFDGNDIDAIQMGTRNEKLSLQVGRKIHERWGKGEIIYTKNFMDDKDDQMFFNDVEMLTNEYLADWDKKRMEEMKLQNCKNTVVVAVFELAVDVDRIYDAFSKVGPIESVFEVPKGTAVVFKNTSDVQKAIQRFDGDLKTFGDLTRVLTIDCVKYNP